MADLVHSIQIAVAAEAVYPLVATGTGFTNWWAADVTEQNGAVDLGFFNRTTVYRLRTLAQEPSRRVEWVCETGAEWAGTRLIFVLEPQSGGTLLRFTHAGWHAQTDYFVACNTTWGALMMRLKAAAEGKSPGPLFLADGMAY
jgi:uncharacterized protein YndB with AHSA1/START domain